MSLSELCIRRPVLTTLITASFIVFGVFAYRLLPVAALPRVDVILTYQGASADLIKAAADLGAKGIVTAGAGAGALSGSQGEGVAQVTDKGVFVVSTTRTGAGNRPPFARHRTATPRCDRRPRRGAAPDARTSCRRGWPAA